MTSKSLKGRKILVTAYDLEQNEHRGIAVYSKSLIHCLNEAGAEVWLLTEFFDKLSEKGLRKLPKITQAMIRNARILNSLALGRRERPTTILQRKFALARRAKAWGNYFSKDGYDYSNKRYKGYENMIARIICIRNINTLTDDR